MTTIAWDGATLAADKMSTSVNLATVTTKLWRHENMVFAGCGNTARLREMYEWVRNGRVTADLPAFQHDDDKSVHVLLIEDGKPYLYEESHVPIAIEMPFFALGTGRDYAMAAMHLGKTAREAVEVACLFDPNSGNGVDVLEIT